MKITFRWAFLAALPLVIFALQGPLTWYKLGALKCSALPIQEEPPICDAAQCYQRFLITPKDSFLVLGHIVRSHTVTTADGMSIFPISRVTTSNDETWPELYVYEVQAEHSLIVHAQFPETARVSGFSGLSPRSCPTINAQSVPSISPTLHLLAHCLLGVFLLIAWMSSRLVETRSISQIDESRWFSTLVLLTYMGTFLLGTHLFDSIRNGSTWVTISLRTLAVFGYCLPAIGAFKISRKIIAISFGSIAAITTLAVFFGRVALTPLNLPFYGIVVFAAALLSLIQTLIRNGLTAGALYSLVLLDAARILGYRLPDFPPVYWNVLALGTYGVVILWRQGASEILPLARHAYNAITRDLHSLRISTHLECNGSVEGKEFFDAIEGALRALPQATSCGRVTLALLLPNRPVTTFIFDQSDGIYRTIDDGKLKGAIFTRVLLYTEFFWFATIAQLKQEGFVRLTPAEELSEARYFCAIPLLHKGQTIGILALTRFRDADLEKKDNNLLLRELRNRITVVSKQLESFLQSKILDSVQNISDRISRMMSTISEVASSAQNTEVFMEKTCSLISAEANCQLMLFRRHEGNLAKMVFSSKISEREHSSWSAIPMTLAPEGGNRIGPVVVAFNEGRSSYVRDIVEIFPQLHETSQRLMTESNISSFIAAPILSEVNDYVIVIFSRKQDPSLSPAWVTILKEVQPTLVANVRSISRASDVEAFGRLTLRLIEDPSIRHEVLVAAKNGLLPPTIGATRESLIFVTDIMGSTQMDKLSSKEKADRYGLFYNEVQLAAEKHVSATIRKRNGDGVILSVNSEVRGIPFKNGIIAFTHACDQAAKKIGCSGARVVVHFGEFFFGLIGTNTSGSIDAIGEGIDKVCKLEDEMKSWKRFGLSLSLGISQAALTELIRLEVVSYSNIEPSGSSSIFGSYYVFKDAIDFLEFPHSVVKKPGRTAA